MAAAELFTDVVRALSNKHSRENVVLKGMHKKSNLEEGSSMLKTWLTLAKEKVGLCF